MKVRDVLQCAAGSLIFDSAFNIIAIVLKFSFTASTS